MAVMSRPVVDWDTNPAPEAPTSPESIKESGLTAAFLADMIARTIYTRGPQLGRDLAQVLCLPFKIIREPLKHLKDEKHIQVDGGDLVGEVSYRFSLTDRGRAHSQDLMKQCAYVGPAPVPLDDYVEQCYRQTVSGLSCYPEVLRPRSATSSSKTTSSTPSARPSSAVARSSSTVRPATAKRPSPAASAST